MLNWHTIKYVVALSVLFCLLFTMQNNQEKLQLHDFKTMNDGVKLQLHDIKTMDEGVTFDCSDRTLHVNFSAHPIGPPGIGMYIVHQS